MEWSELNAPQDSVAVLRLAEQFADTATDARGRKSYEFDEHGIAGFAAAIASLQAQGGCDCGEPAGEPHKFDCPAVDAAPGAAAVGDAWRAAVTDACVIACIDWDENDPRGSLDRLIAWREEIALDPRVSSRAAALATPSAPVGVVQDLRRLADEVMHESVEEESHGWRSLPAMRVCYFVRQLRAIAAALAATPAVSVGDAKDATTDEWTRCDNCHPWVQP